MSENKYSVPGENWVDGVRHLPSVTGDVLEKVKAFPVHPDDIYICSYPKAGSVWMRAIIEGILGWEKDPTQPYLNHLRLIEVFYQDAITLPHPDIFKCHLPFHQLPKDVQDGKAKVVVVVRNPKDLAVSYHYFHQITKLFGPWDGPWDVFFENFIEGKTVFGSYFDHLRSFWEVRDMKHILFIEYENLKADPSHWIGKIAEFLEKPLDGKRLAQIVRDTEFNNMKQKMGSFVSSAPYYKGKVSFMRKGQVGDWRNYFTEEQHQRMDKKYREFCEDVGRPYHAF